MFARIVPAYDLLNRTLSLGCDRLWRKRLASAVKPGSTGRILDIAAGTLDVALALHARYPHISVPAVDFCLPMLQKGRGKLQKTARILPVAGDATRLPLADASVDACTMAFGIRNIPERGAAFAEMLRVLAPGGRACVLEFASGRKRIWGGLYNLYLERLLPALGRLVSGDKDAYAYLAQSIYGFPDAAALTEELLGAGFARARFESVFAGVVCLYIADKAR
jgi:demethylmenaquinone methyltransferase/2-methoxy-6-polyprenyl-1,4-benzoquinol methylase